jgi:hypothetical protein
MALVVFGLLLKSLGWNRDQLFIRIILILDQMFGVGPHDNVEKKINVVLDEWK